MRTSFSWNNIIGLSRSLLAFGTLLTLNTNNILFNHNTLLQNISSLQGYGLFYLLRDYLWVAKILGIIILISVILGYYPRFTGILHWYVSWSFFTSCNIIDGGDHIASVLTLLLIPITLTDKRKNHWDSNISENDTFSATISNAFLFFIKIQICAIYLHAFVGKIPVDEWLNGTAAYYWLTHEYFGINETISPFLKIVLSNNVIVSIVTWGVLLLEFLLASCIILDRKSKTKKIMFILGILFHFLILIVHGLVTFFFSISTGLILYLLSDNKNIKILTLSNITNYGKRIYRAFNI